MNTISIVRAEIDRRKNNAETLRERNICIDLLSFLDTLEEKSEKPINPVDFDKAWEEYGKSKGGGAITVNVKDLARHFFELGKQGMNKCSFDNSEKPNNHEGLDEAAEEWVRPIMRIPSKAHEFLYTYLLDAFRAGAEWDRSQGRTTALND
jgi:hypothetical protein